MRRPPVITFALGVFLLGLSKVVGIVRVDNVPNYGLLGFCAGPDNRCGLPARISGFAPSLYDTLHTVEVLVFIAGLIAVFVGGVLFCRSAVGRRLAFQLVVEVAEVWSGLLRAGLATGRWLLRSLFPILAMDSPSGAAAPASRSDVVALAADLSGEE